MENDIWIFALGFTAQALFSGRMLIQWVLSEKEKKVVSPTIYWKLSLLASFLFMIYGWLREDFVIILGQIISYYIYIWNLNNKNHWKKIYPIVRLITILIPAVALGFVLYDRDASVQRLFANIPLKLLLFGSVGQIIFTLRFVYQWWYSRLRGESILPTGFWILSIIGSVITITYGVFREDPVLIIGHSVGFITYARNLWLQKKQMQ